MTALRLHWTPTTRIAAVSTLVTLTLVSYFAIGTAGNWEFAVAWRARKAATMVLVGWATAVATVTFQTVTNNRILTPSIMGLDALYAFVHTTLVFTLGVSFVQQLGIYGLFGLNLTVMLVVSSLLFGWLFGGVRRSLYLVVLVGIVLGTLLRSASALLTRMLDPTSFLVLQSNLFASFNAVHPELLSIGAVLIGVVSLWLWRKRDTLDVLGLGRDAAIGLGVDHRREALTTLIASSALVSVSTALVGPMTFLGLIVANLAYLACGTHRHAVTLPFAALLAVLLLVGGQTILEHVLGLATVLSVVIEFFGGIAFIVIVLRRSA